MREELLNEFKRTYKIWEESVRYGKGDAVVEFTWKQYCEARDKLVFLGKGFK